MTREEYKKTYIRMMDSVRSKHKGEGRCAGVDCAKCPLEHLCNNNTHLLFEAFEFIDAVEKWGKEHPAITNADKFKEVFGFDPHPACGNELYDPHPNDAENFWKSEYVEPTIGCVTPDTQILNG